MPNTASPAVARRRVRLALRSARERKDLTQTQVAEAMDWSLSKVMRIEKGEVNVTVNDLRILLDFLDISEPGQVQMLMNDARASRQERYTIDPADRDSLTAAMIELYQFESEAISVRTYHNFVIPGRMQTRDYAAAVMSVVAQQLGPDAMAKRLDVRMRRQERLFAPDGPVYLMLLDESVILRRIGSRQVTMDQLEFLRRLASEGNVRLRIVSLSAGGSNKYFYGPFELCDLDSTESAFLYKEDGPVDYAVHSEDEINRHRIAFDDMWTSALDEKESLERIATGIEYLRDPDGQPHPSSTTVETRSEPPTKNRLDTTRPFSGSQS